MNGVDIVAIDDVGDDPDRMGDGLRLTRVEIELLPIAPEDLRLFEIKMVGTQLLLVVGGHPIGVEPGVQLHAARMALFDHELQRIPEGIGGDPLLTGQETGPGFQFGSIEGIGLGPHLEDHGVAAHRRQAVERGGEPLLDLFARHRLDLLVAHDVKPGAAKLALRQLLRKSRNCQQHGQTEGEEAFHRIRLELHAHGGADFLGDIGVVLTAGKAGSTHTFGPDRNRTATMR